MITHQASDVSDVRPTGTGLTLANLLDQIELYAGNHAIEVANYSITLTNPIDQADIRRFDERLSLIKEYFPAISTPNTIQVEVGGRPPHINPPSLVSSKDLTLFGGDGKPVWTAHFGHLNVVVSCRQYTRWNEIWPEAKKRLELLLSLVDQYKMIQAIDYSVTDTFRALTETGALCSRNLFRQTPYIPSFLLEYDDPRWDISQGWFVRRPPLGQVLVRLDSRAFTQGPYTSVSIANIHSRRSEPYLTLREVLDSDASYRVMEDTFEKFHDWNKSVLKSVLVHELQSRMGLINAD